MLLNYPVPIPSSVSSISTILRLLLLPEMIRTGALKYLDSNTTTVLFALPFIGGSFTLIVNGSASNISFLFEFGITFISIRLIFLLSIQ